MSQIRPQFYKAIKPYMEASPLAALWQLTNTVVPYFSMLYMMWLCLEVSYWLSFFLSIPTAGLLMRLFVIQHDCGHGSFFVKKWQNDLLGNIIGVFTLTPYEYWLKQHAIHHATSGNLEYRGNGDVLTLTVEEYLKAPRLKQVWYRIYRNPIFLFFVGAPVHFFFLQRVPLGNQIKQPRSWVTVMATNIAIVGLVVLFAYWVGWVEVLFIYAPVVTFSGMAGTWLFYVQHQFENTYWSDKDNWRYDDAALLGCSHYNLPKVLHWFTGSIGFHHIHHLCSKIPNYRLQECYYENPILQKAPKLGVIKSMNSLRLALWDENQKKLISFAEMARLYRRSRQAV